MNTNRKQAPTEDEKGKLRAGRPARKKELAEQKQAAAASNAATSDLGVSGSATSIPPPPGSRTCTLFCFDCFFSMSPRCLLDSFSVYLDLSLTLYCALADPTKKPRRFRIMKKERVRKFLQNMYKWWGPEKWIGEAAYARFKAKSAADGALRFELDGEDGWMAGPGWADHDHEVETELEGSLVSYDEDVDVECLVDEKCVEICELKDPGRDAIAMIDV